METKQQVFWIADLGILTGNSTKANSINDAIQAGLNKLNEFNGRPSGMIWVYFENPEENIYTEDFQIVKSDGKKLMICDKYENILQTMNLKIKNV